MNIEKSFVDKDLTVSIEGRIDTITSDDLDKSLKEEIGNITSLTLDFSNVEYISSSGLRVIIATQKRLNDDDVRMKITNVNEIIKEIFHMSGFDKILDIQ